MNLIQALPQHLKLKGIQNQKTLTGKLKYLKVGEEKKPKGPTLFKSLPAITAQEVKL